ncbi:IclR family transcriptional regulator [Halomontanus rarus]|uniref:IclR family transcriptional regulator n=1 Tax=Halomontanus rarus TaxID=3034020 RepID=UPI00293BDF97|nr:IclR family transcriptional regulator [Halovivax sp. KZCA124]
MSERDEMPIGTVGTVFDILDELSKMQGGGVTEIANRTDMSTSSVHRYLDSLRRTGFVRKEETEYFPSNRLLKYGDTSRSLNDFYTTAKPVVDELVNRTNEGVAIAVEESAVVYIYRSWRDQEIRSDLRLGHPYEEFHCSAAGKALLASMSDDRVATVLEKQGLPAKTANTITDREELFDELATIRESGVAYEDEELIVGMRSVATTITSRDTGENVGVLTVYGPTIRLDGDTFWEEVPTTLKRAGNLIEVNMQIRTNY